MKRGSGGMMAKANDEGEEDMETEQEGGQDYFSLRGQFGMKGFLGVTRKLKGKERGKEREREISLEGRCRPLA